MLEQVIILELLTTFYLYATYSGIKYSRTVIFLSGIFMIPLDTAARLLWDRVKGRRIPKKRVSCAVVGSETLRNNLITALEETRSSWQVRARMGMNRAGLKTLERLLEENSLDHAILLQEQEEQVFEDAISLCEKYGCRISVVPAFQAAMSPSACVKQIGDIRLLEFRVSPLDHPVQAFIKRLCDIVGSVLLLILFSPVMLIAAIGTKLSSPGPVFFRQKRVGKHRKPFYHVQVPLHAGDGYGEHGLDQRPGSPENPLRLPDPEIFHRRAAPAVECADGGYEPGGPPAGGALSCGPLQGRNPFLSRPPAGEARNDRLGPGTRPAGGYQHPGPDQL